MCQSSEEKCSTAAEMFPTSVVCTDKYSNVSVPWRETYDENLKLHNLLLFGYRLGPVNLNTVNSKFHLIQTVFKICETFLSFEC